jgi:hypothetical protein
LIQTRNRTAKSEAIEVWGRATNEDESSGSTEKVPQSGSGPRRFFAGSRRDGATRGSAIERTPAARLGV